MKAFAFAAMGGLLLCAAPLAAQDSNEVVVVTGSRISSANMNSLPALQPYTAQPPVIGLKRQADSAVRNVEIVSDSREELMRKREVQAMLLDAIARAKGQGMTLVTGQFELTEITAANWQDHFPALAGKPDPEEDQDDYNYNDDYSQRGYQDDGANTRVRLKVKTKLDGSIGSAQQKIDAFVKAVPVTGRSLIVQQGGLALTIVNPEQYRDEIYKRIAAGAKHAESFYASGYGLTVNGLDSAIGWSQVSNTEVFLYIPYSFTIGK